MKTDHSITLLCETLEVSRSGYHAWACGDNQRRARADEALRPKLHAAFAATRQSYGYPRMTAQLRAQGEQVGKTRVARLMREEGLQGRQRRAFRPRTTDSHHDGPIAPNRLAQAGAITACDQVWQTDITYLPTRAGWLYLAVVIDAHSKRVLGWAFSPSLKTGFVIVALLMAIRRRGGRCAPGLLLHSDRGVQYASERFRAQLASHGITASMSRRGNCYDNARAEAFFSTLKIELVYRNDFHDHDHARQVVFEWIEAFYNLRRRHSSIGNLSPVDFENQKN
jgi:transposase InsO family protein